MKKRQLGQSEIAIAPLALGGNVFGWTIDEPTSFKVLDAFVEAGFSLIDTADVYSRWVTGNVGGESETIIGNWMKDRGNRRKVVIATKVGSEIGPGKRGLGKEYIIRAIEDSLRRLRTDYIDLYQSHRDDLTTPVEETLSAYALLIKEGKVRVIGASNFSVDRLDRSLVVSKERGLPRYESLQPLYNLYDRTEFERTLAPLCKKEHVGVITYSSLASGFLTGKYRTGQDVGKSVRGHRASEYFTGRGYRILDALDTVARKHQAELATVALAWLIAQPAVVAPIASATSVEQVKALVAAPALKLDRSDLKTLDQASAEVPDTEKAA
jgi:aryl-alcohol dehydrogenase-like predicted oxidoreductase